MRYIKVFDVNLNYIAGFKARGIGPIYIRIMGLTFLYFEYKDLYLGDQPLDTFDSVGRI